jgi:hypothetical protein
MRTKFLGTACYLAWHGNFVIAPVRYILLFEPPSASDAALLGPFQDLVRSEMSNPRHLNISVIVKNVDVWNRAFSQYPVRRLR